MSTHQSPAADPLATVKGLREALWDGGFRPVPVYNHDSRLTAYPGKAPKGNDWTGQARMTPPVAAQTDPDPAALNTGILCDGLRAIDIDIDNPTLARAVLSNALTRFGECPMRTRPDSPRCLLLYRAAEGQPRKRSIAGTFGKVEILGHGQQFVAFGLHPTGGELAWMPESPRDITVESLIALTEQDITDFLADAANIIGAKPEVRPTDTAHPNSSRFGLRADTLQVVAALSAIPNTEPQPNWEWWNRIGMAIWAATGGGQAGRAVFHAWSEPHPAYDADETNRRWDHYGVSPPTQIGAGTLFHMAREAPQPDEQAPQPDPDTRTNPDVRPDDALPLVFYDDIRPVLATNDFVEGLLIEGSSVVCYGESNSGKTFFFTDLALHVAAGRPWCGRDVIQGGVVYVVLEGSNMFFNRIEAWRQEVGHVGPVFLAVIPSTVNLLDPDADTGRLIAAILEAGERMGVAVKMAIIDTLARAMGGGNENSPEDMGALVMNMDRIRAATRALLAFIHHSGKDAAKGARGHSSLRAAVDTEIEVVASEVGPGRTATVVKQRDLEKSGEFHFQLKVVELGTNQRGKPVTSCVIEPTDGQLDVAADDPSRRLSGHPRRAYEVLVDLLASGQGRSGHPGTPSGAVTVFEGLWRETFYARAMAGAEAGAKQRAFRRAADTLINHHIVGMAGAQVWPVRQQDIEGYST